MELKVNSVDKITELKSTSVKSNTYYSTQHTYRSSSYDTTTSKSSSRMVSYNISNKINSC